MPFSAPAGDFILRDSELPIVLISGGIGITPVLSMLNSVVQEQANREVWFIHAAANSSSHAFKEHLSQLSSRYSNLKSYVCYSSPTENDRQTGNFDREGRIDLDWLQSIVPSKKAEFYFCGSIPFMEAINHILIQWGVEQAHIHYESFSPLAILSE